MDRIEIVYKCYYTFLTTLYDNLDDHEILIQGEKNKSFGIKIERDKKCPIPVVEVPMSKKSLIEKPRSKFFYLTKV